MANIETGSKGFVEEIQIKQGADAVALTTTTTQKEVFLSVEEAVKKKEAESRSNRAMSFGLRVLGLAGIIVGGGLFTKGFDFSNQADIAEVVGGLALIVAGERVLNFVGKKDVRADLVSRQLKKIK